MFDYGVFKKERAFRDFLAHTHISLKNRYVYMGVAKAANSTIKFYLQQVEYLGTPYKVTNVHNKHYSPLLSPYQLPADILEEAFFGDSFTRFTLVRNPYARLLSCFLDRVQDEKSASFKNLSKHTDCDPRSLDFNSFVQVVSSQEVLQMDCHWRPQVNEIYWGLIDYTEILRFENLPQNIMALKELTGCDDKRIFNAEINKSPSVTSAGTKIQEYYSEETAELVRSVYQEDFEKLGYTEELLPV